jgi:predicted lipid-binding transport protein (Tim44 family)
LAARKGVEAPKQTEQPEPVAVETTPNTPAVSTGVSTDSKPTPTTPPTPQKAPDVQPATKDQSSEFKPTRGMSQGQKQRLAQLRDLILQTKGIDPDTQPDEARAAWTDALSPFGVTTAKDLPNSSIPKLIDYLEKKWDAFPTPQPE